MTTDINQPGYILDLQGQTHTGDINVYADRVAVRNGIVEGDIRVWPPQPSAAVSNARVEYVEIRNGSVRFGPYTRRCSAVGCSFAGRSASPSIYLSAESGNHVISGCHFGARTTNAREVVAVDGSEQNLITGNRFNRCEYGGVYVYRNSGEGGVVRKLAPKGNRIENNIFDLSKLRWIRWKSLWLGMAPDTFPRGIILGSRQGSRKDHDANANNGYSPLDEAQENIVRGNTFKGAPRSRWVFDNDEKNLVTL